MTVLGGEKRWSCLHIDVKVTWKWSRELFMHSCNCSPASLCAKYSWNGGDGEDDDLLFSDLTNLQCS